jgi:hypothetical protein
MPTSPSSTARSAAAPAEAANTRQNSSTATRVSLLAIPLLAVVLASALRRETGPRVFTKAELAQYVDTSRGLKVAICGQVFDVSKGAELCGNQPVCRVHDDAAVLAPWSGEEPASPRHRAGVASMACRSTRRFSTNAP